MATNTTKPALPVETEHSSESLYTHIAVTAQQDHTPIFYMRQNYDNLVLSAQECSKQITLLNEQIQKIEKAFALQRQVEEIQQQTDVTMPTIVSRERRIALLQKKERYGHELVLHRMRQMVLTILKQCPTLIVGAREKIMTHLSRWIGVHWIKESNEVTKQQQEHYNTMMKHISEILDPLLATHYVEADDRGDTVMLPQGAETITSEQLRIARTG